jgi:hypothetical protein
MIESAVANHSLDLNRLVVQSPTVLLGHAGKQEGYRCQKCNG